MHRLWEVNCCKPPNGRKGVSMKVYQIYKDGKLLADVIDYGHGIDAAILELDNVRIEEKDATEWLIESLSEVGGILVTAQDVTQVRMDAANEIIVMCQNRAETWNQEYGKGVRATQIKLATLRGRAQEASDIAGSIAMAVMSMDDG